MQLHISVNEGKPIYRQIVEQIKYMIASGRLSRGDELPGVRVLAQQLLINPNTVQRAYRELENEGLLFKRQGAGTYVSESGSPLARREQRRILAQRADALVTEAVQMNFSLEETGKIVEERYGKLKKDGES
jgi:GntR family transcriptional regulator